jgi:hypothetical protein
MIAAYRGWNNWSGETRRVKLLDKEEIVTIRSVVSLAWGRWFRLWW